MVAMGVQQTKQRAEPIGLCSLINVSSTLMREWLTDCQVWQHTWNPSIENVEARPRDSLDSHPHLSDLHRSQGDLSQKDKGGGLLKAPRVDL